MQRKSMTDIKEANFANILFFKKLETKQDNEIMIIIPILLLLSFFCLISSLKFR